MSFWHRVEPNATDADLTEGIQARVADPLWAMARQWQLGEFRGEDAASPVHVRAKVHSTPVRTFRNDAEEGAPVEPFASPHPLECRVEAESVEDGPAALKLAAEAGAAFLRRLDLLGLHAVREAVDWPAEFPLDLAGIELDVLPAPTRRRLRLLARRGVDGRKLLAVGARRLRDLPIPRAQRRETVDAWRAWRAEVGDRFRGPGPSGDCWVEERQEYAFSVGASLGRGELVLEAEEYAGGHLDWHHFRVAEGETHGLVAGGMNTRQLDLLPMPVTYRGQPAARWWEFEDRSVYFGNIDAGPADLARLIVAEFGAAFSDDWFVVPVRASVGSVLRVGKVQILDTFGEVHDLRSTAAMDHDDFGDERPWAFFELEGDTAAADGLSPLVFVPPALASSLHSEAVEHVTLVRDEAANLAWGIERTVELPTGKPMRRRQQWQASTASEDEAGEGTGAGEESDAWRYRLQTPVPPWWIPFVPERAEGGAEVRLRRSRMQAWEELDPALVGAKGVLLGVRRALRLYEEEVPRGGVQITRRWQMSRGADGSVHLWMARRKRPGRGDRGSGLEFDVMER